MEDRFKFRAWNKNQEYMYKNVDKPCIYDDEHLILMQCTGLKDKNGKLIFEGDIVRSDEYPFNSDGDDNYYAEICFCSDTAKYFYYPVKNTKLNKVRGASVGMTGDIDEHIFEIIGNIYENKELLKEGE